MTVATASDERNWFVIDAPITQDADDAFGHNDVAGNLHRMVTEPSGHRRMIGLFGGFGVGKSTVLELLARKLEGSNTQFKLVRMSAERHEPVGFHRAAVYAFAEALVEAGEVSETDAEKLLLPLRVAQTSSVNDLTLAPIYRLMDGIRKLFGTSWAKFLVVLGAALLVAVAAILVLGLTVPDGVWAAFGSAITAALTAAGLLTPILWLGRHIWTQADLGALTKSGTTAYQSARAEAADEHERTFAALATKANHRLIVAVDDIDRLSQDQVLDALNAIRSFQLTCRAKNRPIFIVSLDETIVRRAISSGHDGDPFTPENAQEFLNRLFTLRQDMPVHETSDLRDYALQLLRNKATAAVTALGGHDEDVVSVLIYEEVKDPRHVVRLLNALVGNLRLAKGREGRSGARSLRGNLVTQFPEVLARITVLKTDFPAFFEAVIRDTSLLEAASQALGLDSDEKQNKKLIDEGFDPSVTTNRALFKYLARTAGWIPAVPDIVPFLYLGQDRFSRSLGDRQATRVNEALTNNLPADLLNAAVDLSPETPEREAFQELLVASLRELSGLEQANGVAATIGAAEQSDVFRTTGIADTIAGPFLSHPEISDSVIGAIHLAQLASDNAAQKIVRGILSDASLAPSDAILSNRNAIEAVVGVAAVEKWALGKINKLDVWSEVAMWSAFDLPETNTYSLLNRAAVIADNSDEQPTEETLDKLEVLRESINERRSDAQVDLITRLISLSPHEPASVVGQMLASVSELEDSQLAALCAAVQKASNALPDGESPSARLAPYLVMMAERAATDAPDYGTGTGEARIFSAARVVDVLASWIPEERAESSDVAAALNSLIKNNIKGQVAPAKAIFAAWVADPDGQDRHGNRVSRPLEQLGRALDRMEPKAVSALREAFSAALLGAATRAPAALLVRSFLNQKSSSDWADSFVTELTTQTGPSAEATPSLFKAIAALISTKTVSPSVQGAFIDQLESLNQYSGSARWVIDSASLFDWDPEVLLEAVGVFVTRVDEIDSAGYWSLFDQQARSGQFVTNYLARAAAFSEAPKAELSDSVVVRGVALAEVLPISQAVSVALKVATVGAIETAVRRISESSEVADALRLAADPSVDEDAAGEICRALVIADSESYSVAVNELLDDSLDISTEVNRRLWTFVTVPMSDSDRDKLWTRLKPELLGSTAQVTLASKVLVSVGTDPNMDKLVSADIAEIMWVWTSDTPSAENAASIAAAVRSGTQSNTRALERWKREPRAEDRRTAFLAAKRELDDSTSAA